MRVLLSSLEIIVENQYAYNSQNAQFGLVMIKNNNINIQNLFKKIGIKFIYSK